MIFWLHLSRKCVKAHSLQFLQKILTYHYFMIKCQENVQGSFPISVQEIDHEYFANRDCQILDCNWALSSVLNMTLCSACTCICMSDKGDIKALQHHQTLFVQKEFAQLQIDTFGRWEKFCQCIKIVLFIYSSFLQNILKWA